jgi:hypothetical protein
MIPRLLAGLLALVVLVAAIWGAGFLIAARERAAAIESEILGPTAPVTIDLRPAVYADLPDPVRRYFDFAFNGQTEVTVRYVAWAEQGDFLLPVGPFYARGRQVSRPDAPAYVWSGTFFRFGLPLLESRDAFYIDRHDMRAKLFGWVKVMHTDYTAPADIASLHSYLVLRYYGQAPLMPWALLPNRHVAWVARDDRSAWLEITRDGLEGRYLVTFAADGRIELMETDRLLMEGNGTLQREVGLKLDYRSVNGFNVPTRMDYRWYLGDDTLSSHYAFEVTGLTIVRK